MIVPSLFCCSSLEINPLQSAASLICVYGSRHSPMHTNYVPKIKSASFQNNHSSFYLKTKIRKWVLHCMFPLIRQTICWPFSYNQLSLTKKKIRNNWFNHLLVLVKKKHKKRKTLTETMTILAKAFHTTLWFYHRTAAKQILCTTSNVFFYFYFYKHSVASNCGAASKRSPFVLNLIVFHLIQ